MLVCCALICLSAFSSSSSLLIFLEGNGNYAVGPSRRGLARQVSSLWVWAMLWRPLAAHQLQWRCSRGRLVWGCARSRCGVIGWWIVGVLMMGMVGCVVFCLRRRVITSSPSLFCIAARSSARRVILQANVFANPPSFLVPL